MSNSPIVSREAAQAALDRLRPGMFVRTFLVQLENQGEHVLHRLFTIATDPGTADKDALKAIDMVLRLSKSEDILAMALGLKQSRGRPGSEEDREKAEQIDAWANAVDLHETPPGSGEFKEDPDAA